MTGRGRTVAGAVGLVLFMGGMGWAAVPLYDWFCRVTGYGGATSVASAGGAAPEILDRTITVRFDASTERGMPWQFRPLQREMEVRHRRDRPGLLRGAQPHRPTGCGQRQLQCRAVLDRQFFVKIDCFCFEQQVLGPGERSRCR
jgi:cytochrome c oxidase assembly protein subunit 11